MPPSPSLDSLPPDEDPRSLVADFVNESRENLQLAERRLLALEGSPDPEIVNELFRAIHTVKGAAGFFKLDRMASLAHSGESLLSKVRDGKIAVEPPLVDALLGTADLLLSMLDRDDLGQGVEVSDLILRLERCSNPSASSGEPSVAGLEEAWRLRSGKGKILYAVRVAALARHGVTPRNLDQELTHRFSGAMFEVLRDGDPVSALTGGPDSFIFLETVLEPEFVRDLMGLEEADCRVVSNLSLIHI